MKELFDFSLSKVEKYAFAGLIIIFLLTRFINLTILPIFTDEAIYIRWSEIAWNVRSIEEIRSNLFIPLSDGKQPLFMWLSGVPMQFMSDHLWAGRLPSIISGLFALIGIWLAAYEIFKSKKIAWTSAIIYLVLPFTLLYDRMALADSMLTMFGIWIIYFSFLLLRTLRLKVAVILGATYGLALLTKSPGLFFWLLTPATLLFFNNSRKDSVLYLPDYFIWKWNKELQNKLLRWAGLWLIAVGIGQAFQYSLRVSNMYHMIGRKNLEFILTFEEFQKAPFALLYGNMFGMSVWLTSYLGIILTLFAIVGLVIALVKLDKRILYLSILAMVPWLISASTAKVLYPRYLLFFTPPILIIIAYGMSKVTDFIERTLPKSFNVSYTITPLLYILILLQSLNFSYLLLTDPTRAPLPLQDKDQFVEDWASGYGVDEAYDFLKSELDANGKLAIGTEGTFGLMPFALQIKFYDEIYRRQGLPSRLFIDGFWPFESVPQKLIEYTSDRPTYFLVYQRESEMTPECPLKLVKTIKKPGGKHTIRLYKVLGQNEYKPVSCTSSVNLYQPITNQ
jgi:hypothetical protein